MRLAGAYLRDFEPFADQAIEFAEKSAPGLAEVHFFVGQNGTGKTRLLSLLAAACGNAEELKFRTSQFKSSVVASSGKEDKRFQFVDLDHSGINPNVGSLSQILRMIATHPVPKFETATPRVTDPSLVAMAFRSVPSLSDQKVTPMGEVKWGEQDKFLTFNHHANESAQICQGLANLKVRMGIVSSDPKDRTVRMVHAFDQAIQSITDRELVLTVGYVNKEFRLKASWAGREMQLKQLPDGLRSIIGWLASCVVKLDMLHPDVESPLDQSLILLLDEPDAHLHPAWQRKLIPAVQSLLPNAQIFVATHSPFVISSVNHGWIYVFKANADGNVTIEPPKPCSEGDSYIDVVEDVLGLREQFDPETEKLLSEFRKKRDGAKQQRTESTLNAAKELATSIAKRGKTLRFMMGREMAQLETQLAKAAG